MGYCSANSILKWLNYMKRNTMELQEEAKSDNIYDVLHDKDHEGYVREYKEYIRALPRELNIKVDLDS